MHPYPDRNPKIEFEERLGEYDVSDSGGVEGYVFKVKINSQPYALKMFKFFDAMEARNKFSYNQNQRISDKELEEHTDPFYAECRAYGRIKEFYGDEIPDKYEKMARKLSDGKLPRRRKGTIAVQCFGYLHLSAEHEEYLRNNHHVVEWNRQESDEEKPIRALVKQLVETKISVGKEKRPNIRRMRDDLWTLHRIGVYPMDVFARNYREGLLLDFGMSQTVPHFLMKVLSRDLVESELEYDMERFDMMILEELKITTRVKAVRKKRDPRTRLEKPQEFLQLDELGRSVKQSKKRPPNESRVIMELRSKRKRRQ